jgi:hypothetical protein
MGFVKGQSGNPAGRRPRTDTEKRQREQIRKALPGIIERLIEQATVVGDTAAAKLLLERVMPALKPTDRPVTLALGDDLAEAGRAVLEALGAGALTPDEGSKLASVIGALARAAELSEFARRLGYIEMSLNERKLP